MSDEKTGRFRECLRAEGHDLWADGDTMVTSLPEGTTCSKGER